MNPLFLLSIGAIGLYFLTKKKAADKLQYYPVGLNITSGKIIYTMEIVNPTTSNLYFDNLFATIESQNLIVGRIQYVGRTIIKAQATTRVSFNVKVVWLDLGTWLAKVYKGEIKDVMIKGTINSMGVAQAIEYKIPLL